MPYTPRDVSGWEWTRIKARILSRDGHACRIVGPGCTRRATEVDHIVPLAEGGRSVDTNLRAVCSTCHGTRSTEYRVKRARLKRKDKREPEPHPGLLPGASMPKAEPLKVDDSALLRMRQERADCKPERYAE